ncbi:hypothetical protein DFR37_11341 [Eoetvoesiella caeni]|uniref:Uncharacterized protein n=1 Tax=Eoetvoesiella caeni TaxID=645616 RepID=A0A366H4B2_9BURK|nr:hypothetical protein DFR37_11341 [Eoetvoesiella caeni]
MSTAFKKVRSDIQSPPPPDDQPQPKPAPRPVRPAGFAKLEQAAVPAVFGMQASISMSTAFKKVRSDTQSPPAAP